MADASNDYGIDLDGASRSLSHGTMLWEITLGGDATLSVSARNHVQAVMLAAEGDNFDGLPWDDELNVAPIPEEKARRASFWDEDSGRTTTLWEEWKRDTAARVVGGSEF